MGFYESRKTVECMNTRKKLTVDILSGFQINDFDDCLKYLDTLKACLDAAEFVLEPQESSKEMFQKYLKS